MTERPDLALHQVTIYGTKEYCIQVASEAQAVDGDMMIEFPSVGCCPDEEGWNEDDNPPCGVCRNCKAYEITKSLVRITRIRKVRKDKKQR